MALAVTAPITVVAFSNAGGPPGSNQTVLYIPGPDGYPGYINPTEAWITDTNCPYLYHRNQYIAFEVCVPASTILYADSLDENNLGYFDTVISVERVPEGTCALTNDDCGTAASCVAFTPEGTGEQCVIVRLSSFSSSSTEILSGISFRLEQV